MSVFRIFFCFLSIFVPTTYEKCPSSIRLNDLRKELKNKGLYGYLIPSGDSHQSEYVAEEDKRLAWISGFTGSSGFAVVTKNSAAVWVDGRYYLQGKEQLDCNWQMMKGDEPETPSWWDWLEGKIEIAADPSLTGAATWIQWEEYLSKKGIVIQ